MYKVTWTSDGRSREFESLSSARREIQGKLTQDVVFAPFSNDVGEGEVALYYYHPIAVITKTLETRRKDANKKVYIVEKMIGPGKRTMEVIALKTNWEIAYGLIGKEDTGMITEMYIDEEYPEGIGVCRHWHFDPNEKDDDGNRLDGLD